MQVIILYIYLGAVARARLACRVLTFTNKNNLYRQIQYSKRWIWTSRIPVDQLLEHWA